jgi:hypothetical protein
MQLATGFFYGKLPSGKFCAKVERKEGQDQILAYFSPLKTERNVHPHTNSPKNAYLLGLSFIWLLRKLVWG